MTPWWQRKLNNPPSLATQQGLWCASQNLYKFASWGKHFSYKIPPRYDLKFTFCLREHDQQTAVKVRGWFRVNAQVTVWQKAIIHLPAARRRTHEQTHTTQVTVTGTHTLLACSGESQSAASAQLTITEITEITEGDQLSNMLSQVQLRHWQKKTHIRVHEHNVRHTTNH